MDDLKAREIAYDLIEVAASIIGIMDGNTPDVEGLLTETIEYANARPRDYAEQLRAWARDGFKDARRAAEYMAACERRVPTP